MGFGVWSLWFRVEGASTRFSFRFDDLEVKIFSLLLRKRWFLFGGGGEVFFGGQVSGQGVWITGSDTAPMLRSLLRRLCFENSDLGFGVRGLKLRVWVWDVGFEV